MHGLWSFLFLQFLATPLVGGVHRAPPTKGSLQKTKNGVEPRPFSLYRKRESVIGLLSQRQSCKLDYCTDLEEKHEAHRVIVYKTFVFRQCWSSALIVLQHNVISNQQREKKMTQVKGTALEHRPVYLLDHRLSLRLYLQRVSEQPLSRYGRFSSMKEEGSPWQHLPLRLVLLVSTLKYSQCTCCVDCSQHVRAQQCSSQTF